MRPFYTWIIQRIEDRALLKAITSPTSCGKPSSKKNPSTLFTTETRSTRRCTENPVASVKSPCPPCLRGERKFLFAGGSVKILVLMATPEDLVRTAVEPLGVPYEV